MRKLLLFLLPLLVSVSCSKEDITGGGVIGDFVLGEGVQSYTLTAEAQSLNLAIVTELKTSDWTAKSSDESWCTVTKLSNALFINVKANAEFKVRNAVVTVEASGETYEIKVAQASANGDMSSLPSDIKVDVSSVTADQEHYTNEAKYTIDGIIGTSAIYHSTWEANGGTTMPVTLEYFFDESEEMDYFIYYPRSDGGYNGFFGEVDVYYKSSGSSSYTFCKSVDFGLSSSATRVYFGEALTVDAVKIVVNSGYAGYASCDEMEFYRSGVSGDLESQLLTVFSDMLCSSLKSNVTDEAIDALPDYFKSIAIDLKAGVYSSEFRVAEYEAYSDSYYWKTKLKTKHYARHNNPTGIVAKAGDELVVFVGETYGNEVKLDEMYFETGNCGWNTHTLVEGMNRVTVAEDCMLFVVYEVDDIQASTAKPIKVHIAKGSGVVDGYYDYATMDNEKYEEMIDAATFTHFCVRGENILFTFHTSEFKTYVPTDINSTVELWDEFVGYQFELMGIDDIRDTEFNNHILAISFSQNSGFMWATEYRIAFNKATLGTKVLTRDLVMSDRDNAWGPAHEIGHINQGAINWTSCTESSNNLFSNYTLYKLGKYCSRGSELYQLAEKRFVHKRAWCNFDGIDYVYGNNDEDTEMHMRMNWQLWNYYHRCGYKTDFFPKLYEYLRNNPLSSNAGQAQLDYAMAASKIANEDLTDFFTMWGFFDEVDCNVNDYSSTRYIVNATMINDALDYMSTLPVARHAFEYIEDRKYGDEGLGTYDVGNVGYYTSFENDTKITKSITYTLSDRKVTVSNGTEAVAYEVYSKDNMLVYFFNFYTYTIPSEIDLDGATFYAVQADGERILMTEN